MPPDEPAGVYRLTIRNRVGRLTRTAAGRALFQIVLAGQPGMRGASGGSQRSGGVGRCHLLRESAEYVPRPGPRSSRCRPVPRAVHVETNRGRFFGDGRGVDRPYPGRAGCDPIRPGRPATSGRSPRFSSNSTSPRMAHAERARHDPRPGRRPGSGRSGHPRLSRPRRLAREPRSDPPLVGTADGDAHRRDRRSQLRPHSRVAPLSGPCRADLGASRLLSGERGVRIPRPVAGLGQPPLGRPRRLPGSRSSSTARSSSSKGTSSTGFISSRTVGPASSGRRMPQDNLLWLGLGRRRLPRSDRRRDESSTR